jgi:hypothetical protein
MSSDEQRAKWRKASNRYYAKNKDKKRAYRNENPEKKKKAQNARWYAKNRERVRAALRARYYADIENRRAKSRKSMFKARFGVDESYRDELLARQGGVCAICESPKAKSLDHCHKTGRIRGVLCGPCNLALGLFNDDPKIITRAAKYLKHETFKKPKPV